MLLPGPEHLLALPFRFARDLVVAALVLGFGLCVLCGEPLGSLLEVAVAEKDAGAVN